MMRRVRPRFGATPVVGWAISAGLLILLAGCTSVSTSALATTGRPSPASTRSTTSTPTPTLTAGASGLVVVPAAPSDTDPAHPPYDVIIASGEALIGHYTNYSFPVQIPHDDGPIRYARGTPITEGSEIVAYKVAPGDIYDYIVKRFHLTNNGYILILNEPRRGEAPPLYAGDVLNLSAYTLNKYGTVNGRIAHGPQPVTGPKQQP